MTFTQRSMMLYPSNGTLVFNLFDTNGRTLVGEPLCAISSNEAAMVEGRFHQFTYRVEHGHIVRTTMAEDIARRFAETARILDWVATHVQSPWTLCIEPNFANLFCSFIDWKFSDLTEATLFKLIWDGDV